MKLILTTDDGEVRDAVHIPGRWVQGTFDISHDAGIAVKQVQRFDWESLRWDQPIVRSLETAAIRVSGVQ